MNVDYHSSLFAILANCLLKGKNFSPAMLQKRPKTVEVRLVKRSGTFAELSRRIARV
jgi:hypothetical protein